MQAKIDEGSAANVVEGTGSEISREIDGLGIMISYLKDRIELLEQKLEPVLRPGTEVTNIPSEKIPETLTATGSKIRTQTESVATLTNRIDSLGNRLEV